MLMSSRYAALSTKEERTPIRQRKKKDDALDVLLVLLAVAWALLIALATATLLVSITGM